MEPAEDAALVVAVAVIANLVDMTDALLLTTRGRMDGWMDGFGFPGRVATPLVRLHFFITHLTVHEPEFGLGTQADSRVLHRTEDSETLCMIHFAKVYRP